MKKIYGLNYIRAICAVFVMLYHYTTHYFNNIINISTGQDHVGLWWGCYAVEAFFILSGYLTVANLNDRITLKDFIYKRVTRIYPAYWVAILCTTFVTYIVNSKMKTDVLSTIFNFTMLQGFLKIKNVDGAYWTLQYELLFYFVIAATLLFKKRNCMNMADKVEHLGRLS